MEVDIKGYSKSRVIKELEEETIALWYNRPALAIAVELLKDIPEESFDRFIYNHDKIELSQQFK